MSSKESVERARKYLRQNFMAGHREDCHGCAIYVKELAAEFDAVAREARLDEAQLILSKLTNMLDADRYHAPIAIMDEHIAELEAQR